jgi:hypothetical protein
LLSPDEVEQGGLEALRCILHELRPKLSCRLPAFSVRLGKVTADETVATINVESLAANDGVGRQIKAGSVIVAARTCPLDASFRLMLKRSTVRAMIHDEETEVDKLQLVRERHLALKQV